MASSSSSSIRTWRTAFLTLRDETLTFPASSSLHLLLHNLIFSQSHSLISATAELPPHEVTSDLMFLIELAVTTSDGAEDFTHIFTHICHLVHGVSQCTSLELNSASWALLLDSFGQMVEHSFGKPGTKRESSANTAAVKAIIDCLDTLRLLINTYRTKCSLSENIQLVKFLLHIISCSHAELYGQYCSSGNQRHYLEIGTNLPRYNSLWEVQTLAFTMSSEVLSKVGSSIPVDLWQLTIEVLRKVMDVIASKSLLVEDDVMSRFYASILNCLHLVLTDPKGSISDHVAGFVAALQLFFIYGLSSKPHFISPVAGDNVKECSSISVKPSLDFKSCNSGPYRPPHLRKKGTNLQPSKASDYRNSSNPVSFNVESASSDSDCSDSDGSLQDDSVRSSKVRVAAIVCLRGLCQADPKSFTAQWTMLLPTREVLQPRKYEATLMTCFLFDPYLKARIASAATLAAMLDGPAHVFLQVAEYKEPTKCGSFTALSSSLGQILMQLHTGILYLIQRESHSGLLASSFKILLLLISSTPYARMPAELLPKVIVSIRARIEEDFLFKSDRISLLAIAISCLKAALSTSAPSPHVREMLLEELSADYVEAQGKQGVIFTICRYAERVTSPTVNFEALQALRAVLHSYPKLVASSWEQVSNIVYGFLGPATIEDPTRSWKGYDGNSVGQFGEKVITAAIKVLDEGLRAISGFKGTEDFLDDKFLDTPFTSDYVRMKKISSAPSYGQGSPEGTRDESGSNWSGSEQWCQVIKKHMPLILQHSSAMVRAASITCFAGMTSTVFFSLPNEKQSFIISSAVNAAENDGIPSVRSAACRAIGVIACFPQVFVSAEILKKFIHVVEINTQDPLVLVRITSSWALANLCDSLRHCYIDVPSKCCYRDSNEHLQLMLLLFESALRLAKDGDKVKSNAVRALGNLSRFLPCRSLSNVSDRQADVAVSLTTNNIMVLPSRQRPEVAQRVASNLDQSAFLENSPWLGRVVQAFLSCVTTGNVKVQWNVCHALSNLFQNETLSLPDMDWAPSVFSILLLLLRESSNFKIRIQAAAALSVPVSIFDYGSSFSDIIQGLEHIIENLSSDHISAPSGFKYRVALEKQLTSTMLHVLSVASNTDNKSLKDFLVKKASFFEEWFRGLCSSLGETSVQPEADDSSVRKLKKEMISKAIESLIKVYEGRNHPAIAQRFEMLLDSIL